MVLVYCSVSDVTNFINIIVKQSTNINTDLVSLLIEAKQDDIDRSIGHAFRSKQSVNEVHDIEGDYRYGWGIDVKLLNRQVKTFDYSLGDRIQYYDGTSYIDLLSSSSVLDTNIQVNYEQGIVSIKGYSYSWIIHRKFRFTYRYGSSTVPSDIKLACIKMVCKELLNSKMFTETLPVGNDNDSFVGIVNKWDDDVNSVLAGYSEMKAIY